MLKIFQKWLKLIGLYCAFRYICNSLFLFNSTSVYSFICHTLTANPSTFCLLMWYMIGNQNLTWYKRWFSKTCLSLIISPKSSKTLIICVKDTRKWGNFGYVCIPSCYSAHWSADIPRYCHKNVVWKERNIIDPVSFYNDICHWNIVRSQEWTNPSD